MGFVFNAPTSQSLFGDFSASRPILLQHQHRERDLDRARASRCSLSATTSMDQIPATIRTDASCRSDRATAHRPVLTVSTPFQNLGSLKTDGVELQTHWGLPTVEGRFGGKFYLDTAVSWLRAYRIQLLPGTPFFDYDK